MAQQMRQTAVDFWPHYIDIYSALYLFYIALWFEQRRGVCVEKTDLIKSSFRLLKKRKKFSIDFYLQTYPCFGTKGGQGRQRYRGNESEEERRERGYVREGERGGESGNESEEGRERGYIREGERERERWRERE